MILFYIDECFNETSGHCTAVAFLAISEPTKMRGAKTQSKEQFYSS